MKTTRCYYFIAIYISLQLCIGCAPHVENIYVSPTRKPNNSGSKEAPLPNINEALLKATKTKNNQIIIHVLKGEYHLNSPIKITSEIKKK